MAPSTISGIIIGFTLIIAAVLLTAQYPSDFLSFPSFLIVLGGTVAATLISFPVSEFTGAFRSFWQALKTEERYLEEEIEQFYAIAREIFRGKIREVETEMNKLRSPFLRTGVQLYVDNTPVDDILTLLDWRLARMKERETARADVFRAMAAYAPAFGMIGTLLGLVNMLRSIGSGDLDIIGQNMALALITTFYGVVMANAIFKPMAINLERKMTMDSIQLNVAKEAVILLTNNRSPAYIRDALHKFLEEADNELDDTAHLRAENLKNNAALDTQD